MRGVDIAIPTLDVGFDKEKKRDDKNVKAGPVEKRMGGKDKGAGTTDNAPAGDKAAAPKQAKSAEEPKDAGDVPADANVTKMAAGKKEMQAEKAYSSKKVPKEMQEAGQGERFSGYGVEVVEYLEMESMDDAERPPPKQRPWGKVASAFFMLTFILGLLHVGAVLYYSSGILTPDEALGGVCEIAGEVRDTAGNPVANATVVVTDLSRSAFTNSDGWYVMRGLSQGQHRVEATAEGYNSMSIKVDLRPNLLKSIDFTLEKDGNDISLDESAGVDFSMARDSYLWSAPLFIALSTFALAAALMALRKEASRMTVLLGAISIASFGFGIGSVLAVLGTIVAAHARRKRPAPPLKRLRVGMSYPSPKCDAVDTAAPRHVARREEGPSYAPTRGDMDGHEGSRELEHGGGRHEGHEHHRHEHHHEHHHHEHHDAHGHHEGHEEHEHNEGERHDEHGGAHVHAKRYRRTSPKGHLTCCVCVEEIGLGLEYIRCVCGRNIHVRCLTSPSCPECGHPFGKWKEGHGPQ